MKVCHITDTHIGITQPSSIRKMLNKIKNEEFDLLLHTGDYCGGSNGGKSVASTVKMIREVYDGPFLSTIGNHDYWAGGHFPDWVKSMNQVRDTFKENNVHFIDEDGIYIHPAFPDIKFIGASGWYANPNPPTNDYFWMPASCEGVRMNQYLLQKSEKTIQKQMDELDLTYTPGTDTVCFVSHFPVVKPKEGPGDYKGAFEDFCWSERISQLVNACYDCKYFFNGHAHQLHEGKEMRYEPGSDYGNPDYRIWDII